MQPHQTIDLRIENNQICFTNFGAIQLKIWILHHLNQFLENLYLRKPMENARSTQIHTRRGADRRDPGVVSPRVSHAALRPTSGGRLLPTVRSLVARRAPTASSLRGEHVELDLIDGGGP